MTVYFEAGELLGQVRQMRKLSKLICSLLCFPIFIFGCADPRTISQSSGLNIHNSCHLSSSEWKNVTSPLDRDFFLSMPEGHTGKKIGEIFTPQEHLQEVWFESTSNDSIILCQFDPEKSCYQAGDFRRVTFVKVEGAWKAGKLAVGAICSS